MFLQKQIFRVNFGEGLDAKTDPKALRAGKMTTLQDAQITKFNRIEKRNGFTGIGAVQSSTASINRLNSFQGAVFGVGETGSVTQSRCFYAYSAQANSGNGDFVQMSPIFSDCLVTTYQRVNNGNPISQADSATVNGYTVYAWIDTNTVNARPMAMARVINQSTGQSYGVDFTVSGLTCSMVRCLANGSNLFVAAMQSHSATTTASLYIASITISGLSITPTNSVSIASKRWAWGAPSFDWSTHTTSSTTNLLFLALTHDSSSNDVKLLTLSTTLSTYATSSPAASVTAMQIGVVQPRPGTTSTTLRAIWIDANSRLNYDSRSVTLGNEVGPNLSATNSTTVGVIIGQELSTGSCAVFVSSTSAATVPQTNGLITPYTVNTSGTFAAGVQQNILGLGIHSKMIYRTDTDLYFWCLHPSQLQGQYILMHQTGTSLTTTGLITPSARTLVGNAMAVQGTMPIMAVNVNPSSADIPEDSLISNVWESPCITVGQQFYSAGSLVQQGAVGSMRSDFTFTDAYNAQTLNEQCVITGGFNMLYDGAVITELGFFMYPEGLTASTTSTVGALSVGQYQYAAAYEWYDNNGNLHRSETSVPISITASSVTTSVNVVIPTLRTTLKVNTSSDAALYSTMAAPNIVLYRTTVNANPAVFYRVGSITNQARVQSLSIVDSASDATIIANTPLYTTGGSLDHYTIDGTSIIGVGPDRILAADPHDNGIIHVGQPYNPTDGLSFFASINLQLPTEDGPVTAIVYMDSSYIVFKARSIYSVQGQGPTPNGQGNSYVVQKIASDVGCTGPHLAAVYPDGILFYSEKGFYRLGRDLSFSASDNYIGAEVEDFNTDGCSRVLCVSDLNEVRCVDAQGSFMLVYNYFFKQWLCSIPYAEDATYCEGVCYIANAGPQAAQLMGQETVGAYLDTMNGGTSYRTTIVTGWISLNQLQGAQRIYRIRLLGDLVAAHTLNVELAYDGESFFNETHTIASSAISGGGTAYQAELFPQRQKCESIQIKIYDTNLGVTGGSFDLTDIELQIGIEPGRRYPLASTRGF